MEKYFYEIFESLERQGPGDDFHTAKAYASLTDLPYKADILDIGCGTGKQTICLAGLNEGDIIAVDNHVPFLELLNKKITDKRLEKRIKTLKADMNALPFDDHAFDLIWSEGAVFIMGFDNALVSWNKYLRDKGYLVLSDLVWFMRDAPEEINNYFKSIYPQLKHHEELNSVICNSGYNLIDYFPLPSQVWWTEYYFEMENKIDSMRIKYKDDEALSVIEMITTEISMFRKYSDYYGYMFFVLQKK